MCNNYQSDDDYWTPYPVHYHKALLVIRRRGGRILLPYKQNKNSTLWRTIWRTPLDGGSLLPASYSPHPHLKTNICLISGQRALEYGVQLKVCAWYAQELNLVSLFRSITIGSRRRGRIGRIINSRRMVKQQQMPIVSSPVNGKEWISNSFLIAYDRHLS